MSKDKKKAKTDEQETLFDLSAFTVTPEETDTVEAKFCYKIPDDIFWGVMATAFGICNRAVKILLRDFDIKVSRQAVHVRANKHPARLAECREMMLDAAEEIGMNLLMNGDKRTQSEIYRHITGKLGRKRGYNNDLGGEGEGAVITVKVEHVTNGVPFAQSEKDIDK